MPGTRNLIGAALQRGSNQAGERRGPPLARTASPDRRLHLHSTASQPVAAGPPALAYDLGRIRVLPQSKPPAEVAKLRSEADAVPPIVREVLASAGQPLNRATRIRMESHFGHDFSRVRVHLDPRAAESAEAVAASAYTVGHHVVFAPGRFAPETASGRRLLAHELVHTLQQSGRASINPRELGIGDVNDPHEHQAEHASRSLPGAPDSKPWPLRQRNTLSPDAVPVLRRQPNSPSKDPEPPTFEPLPPKKEEEVGGETPAPAEPSCKYPSTAPLPCRPKGVSNAEFMKLGAPIDAFGITKVPQQTIPNPEIKTKQVGKQFVLLPTKGVQVSCESYYVKAGKPFQRLVPIDQKDPKQARLAEQCGSDYLRDFQVTPDGEKKLIEAEMEHCDDLKYAFDMSLGCYVEIVNEMARKGTRFASHDEAVEAVTKSVGRKPDTWVARYLELVGKTDIRDKRKWHTAAVPEGPGLGLKMVGHQCESATTTAIDDSSFPQVGKHLSAAIIK